MNIFFILKDKNYIKKRPTTYFTFIDINFLLFNTLKFATSKVFETKTNIS